MKKVLSVLLSLHLFAQTGQNKTQGESNFAGTWILEKIQSSPNSFLPQIDIKEYENYFLVISYIGDEFKVKKNLEYKKELFNYEIILYTDERGEKNISPMGNNWSVEKISKTYFKKDKITREFGFKLKPEDKKISIHGIEKYYLVIDGNSLVFESSSESPSTPAFLKGSSITKFIFKRKQ